jgi:hypothetical protein
LGADIWGEGSIVSRELLIGIQAYLAEVTEKWISRHFQTTVPLLERSRTLISNIRRMNDTFVRTDRFFSSGFSTFRMDHSELALVLVAVTLLKIPSPSKVR